MMEDIEFGMERLIEALMDEDREAVKAMLSTMGERETVYMLGYMNGYVDAFRMINDAGVDMPRFHNAMDSDRIAT